MLPTKILQGSTKFLLEREPEELRRLTWLDVMVEDSEDWDLEPRRLTRIVNVSDEGAFDEGTFDEGAFNEGVLSGVPRMENDEDRLLWRLSGFESCRTRSRNVVTKLKFNIFF